MRALVTRRIGPDPVMEVAEVPVPAWRPGYSLIRAEAASINQLSNTIRTGGFGATPLPLIQGNDGASTIVRSNRHPVRARVTALGGGTGAAVAFDPVGGPAFTDLQRSLAPEGTLVAIGFTGGNTPPVDLLDLIAGDKRILGYSVDDEPATWVREGLAAITDLAEGGWLRPRIDTIVPLTDPEAGYTRLASREAIGSVVMTIRS